MKILRNEKGIALVMVLVIAMIGLAVVAALLYLVIQGTGISGSHRFYRTADEAAVGGADVAAGFIRGRGDAGSQLLIGLNAVLPTDIMGATQKCLQEKLLTARGGADLLTAGNWGNCGGLALDVSANPTASPDLRFETPAVPGMQSYRVFVKIVDTVAGNSQTGGIVTQGELYGAGVTTSNAGEVTPPHIPYLYRVEVQAEDANNPRERARYTGLYVY